MEFNEIFAKAKEIFGKADVSNVHEKLAYQYDLIGDNGGTFYIEIKDGTINIELYEYHDRDVKFTISPENFLKQLEGKLNSTIAYTTGKLKIEGDLGKAIRLKDLLGSE